MPETGGLSFAEIDILFARKVPARKFKDVDIVEEFGIDPRAHQAALDGEDFDHNRAMDIEKEEQKGNTQHVEKATLT